MKVPGEGMPVDILITVIKESVKQAGVSRTYQDRDLQVASVQLSFDMVPARRSAAVLMMAAESP